MLTMYFEAITELSRSGPLTVRVNGACMSDTVPDGCYIQFDRQSWYLPGDILVFSRGDKQWVSHRLLGYAPGRSGWKVITKADRETRPDAPHPVSRVLGKAIAINGIPFQPGFCSRLRAAKDLFPALLHLCRQRVTVSPELQHR